MEGVESEKVYKILDYSDSLGFKDFPESQGLIVIARKQHFETVLFYLRSQALMIIFSVLTLILCDLRLQRPTI